MYNLALSYLQNAEDAEEVCQNVFVKVYFSISKFKHNSELSTWLYRIAINASLDFLKAKNRKKRFANLSSIFFETSNEIKHNPIEFNHPGVILEDKEALANIFKYINSLPQNQKTAIILYKIEQLSLNQVAEIMQLKPKALESVIHRAKLNLQKLLPLTE